MTLWRESWCGEMKILFSTRVRERGMHRTGVATPTRRIFEVRDASSTEINHEVREQSYRSKSRMKSFLNFIQGKQRGRSVTIGLRTEKQCTDYNWKLRRIDKC